MFTYSHIQWAFHAYMPKRYSQNEYKTLNQKTTTSKYSYTLVVVRKSTHLLKLIHLQYHLQCKNKCKYNTQ